MLALGVSGRLISFLAGLSAGLNCSACCSTTKIFNVCAEHNVIDDLASDWSPLGSIGSGRQRYIKQLPGRPVGWPGLLRLLRHRCLLSMHPPSKNRIPAGSKCQLYDAFGQKYQTFLTLLVWSSGHPGNVPQVTWWQKADSDSRGLGIHTCCLAPSKRSSAALCRARGTAALA